MEPQVARGGSGGAEGGAPSPTPHRLSCPRAGGAPAAVGRVRRAAGRTGRLRGAEPPRGAPIGAEPRAGAAGPAEGRAPSGMRGEKGRAQGGRQLARSGLPSPVPLCSAAAPPRLDGGPPAAPGCSEAQH
eukprot:TRINITY_DN2320_c0_g1_i3.p2 TRINITY_DN2320_c0_g1~~TRINITY_DN2320_c0_g1_i3.p2  ORF type:complete len:130 (-),score=1.76 TRINITY_DN2320_c0_g1_i3:4-393(-)